MKGLNQTTLLGNLTRDPELRTTTSGTQIASFTLAVNEKYGDKEKTNFIDCTVFGKAAEIVTQYAQKGSSLLISGKLSQSTWEQDGQKRSKIEVIVNDFVFIDSKGDSPRSEEPKQQKIIDDIDDEPVDLSDIPF